MRIFAFVYLVGAVSFFFMPEETFYLINVGPKVFKAFEDVISALGKKHPDVLSGNRRGGVDLARASTLCDHVEREASLAHCLEKADEVHTMTSLVGFEALLRGKRVVVYGQPFYSGWGLTEDRHPLPRRTRRRTIDELVACTLVRYPRYLDRKLGHFATPEATIAALVAERDANGTAHSLHVSWARRQLRKVFHAYRGFVHAP
jgi:capsular polysaccharide export protein